MLISVKHITAIILLSLSTLSFGQQAKNIDSCRALYAQALNLSSNFDADTLLLAVEMFDKVLSGECPKETKDLCRYHKAHTLGLLGRDKEALKLLRPSLYQDTSSTFVAYLYLEKFFIYTENEKNRKALKAINESLKNKPTDDEFIFRKATVLLDLGHYDDVLIQLSQIHQRASYILNIHEMRMMAAFKTGNFELAQTSSNFILENDVNYAEQALNNAKLISLLIKRKEGSLNEKEERQLDALKRKNHEPALKKDLR